jgi:Heterokaryon incompatibility protein (HET)
MSQASLLFVKQDPELSIWQGLGQGGHLKRQQPRDEGSLEKHLIAFSKPYQYTRLQSNHIRLLKVRVEASTGILVCEFETRELGDSRELYTAVSYCWGDPTPTSRLLFKNGSYSPLTNSATEILRYVVACDQESYFWIDQICINQSDLVEKAAQVALMGDIFASSLRVIVWLGIGDEKSEKALELGEQLFGLIAKGEDLTKEKIESLVPTSEMNSPWDALIDFLWNPWFNRLWVMQEVVMAPAGSQGGYGSNGVNLATKGLEFSFDRLATVVNEIEENENLAHLLVDKGKHLHRLERMNRTPHGVLAIQHFRHFRSQKSRVEEVNLQHALYRSSNFQASDARDQVYAVVGMTSDVREPALYPNYQARPEEVYSNFTAFLFNREDYPFLLHQAGIGWSRKLPDLPSWVPDFSCSTDTKNLLYKYPELTKNFQSSGSHPVRSMKADPSTNTLTFRGIKIDSIEVFRQYSHASASHTYRQLAPSSLSEPGLSGDLKGFLQQSQARIDSKEYVNQTWTPFSGDDGASASKKPEGFDALNEFNLRLVRSFMRPLDRHFIDWFKNEYPDWDSEHADIIADAISESFRGEKQQFGLMNSHETGHGPGRTQTDDVVFVILGLNTPFLFRPDEDSRKGQAVTRWRLVGECFVQGLMKGEGLDRGPQEDFVVI